MTITTEEILKTIEDEQARLLPDQKSMDKLTIHYLVNSVWAAQLKKLYDLMEEQLAKIDVLKATGTDLDRLIQHALPGGRQKGDHANGQVTFLLDHPYDDDTIIPIGTRVYALLELSTDKLWYKTTEEGVIAAGLLETTVAVVAEERGPDYNIANYSIVGMGTYHPRVVEAENRLPIDGGTIDESDDELRQRYWDKIVAPGRATTTMLERALADLEDTREVKIWNRGFGDVEILIDYSGGIENSSQDIINCIDENIGGGIQARGCLGATVVGNAVYLTNNDAYGGLIWVRPRQHITEEDSFSITYLDFNGLEQEASVTIEAGTHCGEMIKATMVDAQSRAKKIIDVSPSGKFSYDVDIGMGGPGRLYNLPELMPVDIQIHIRVTDGPEQDLIENIEQSVTDFLEKKLKIGDRIEFSDVERFIFNHYDASATDEIGRPHIGIEEITSVMISDGRSAITNIGQRLEAEGDERFIPGEITAQVVD